MILILQVKIHRCRERKSDFLRLTQGQEENTGLPPPSLTVYTQSDDKKHKPNLVQPDSFIDLLYPFTQQYTVSKL